MCNAPPPPPLQPPHPRRAAGAWGHDRAEGSRQNGMTRYIFCFPSNFRLRRKLKGEECFFHPVAGEKDVLFEQPCNSCHLQSLHVPVYTDAEASGEGGAPVAGIVGKTWHDYRNVA